MNKLEQICRSYGISLNSSQEIIDKFPRFTSLNHTRVINEATKVYGEENEVREAILKHPRFASLNHTRVINEATKVYGEKNETKIKEAILKHPSFASYDHTRVVRQKTRIGRLIGLSNDETIDILLDYPVQAGYSYKRDLARIDVARELSNQGVIIDNQARNWFIKNYISSPYTPGTCNRISHSYGEPGLLNLANKKFADQPKAA
ncbi:MAG: hypothetical protein QF567_00505 [Candidatus Pacearchaeota archaeon]|nr:hypothetical protein [Candidatus Pacearchaeota archaeon]MDP7520702.1 hypothetical protein [Candidatus Pacearchaeota archaeon]